MNLRKPGTYFGTSPAGGLGWGLGAAHGVKLGDRDRRVFCVIGDGSYMFGNPTPAHYVSAANDLPVLTVILNNRDVGLGPQGDPRPLSRRRGLARQPGAAHLSRSGARLSPDRRGLRRLRGRGQGSLRICPAPSNGA